MGITFVLFIPDAPPNSSRHRQAAFLTEALEMRRDLFVYMRDPWNVLDWLSLALLSSGLIARIAQPSDTLGRSLYALSTPLLFARLLFFAQILPHQGPMIQVRTILELLRGRRFSMSSRND